MKCNRFGNVSFAMFVLLATTGALAQSRAEANVPFSFHVGSTVLPAGHYQIVEDHIRENVKVCNLATHAIAEDSVQQDTSRGDAMYKLVFHRFGDQYFLAGIHGGQDTLDLTLSTTKLERQYRSTLVASAPRAKNPDVQIALK
jgi:hypothetical protein